jgi:hypothetical protein
MWLEGLGQLKNPMTATGIEAAIFWLVAECRYQLRYRVPTQNSYWALPRAAGLMKGKSSEFNEVPGKSIRIAIVC